MIHFNTSIFDNSGDATKFGNVVIFITCAVLAYFIMWGWSFVINMEFPFAAW